jgi:hypothetical protein
MYEKGKRILTQGLSRGRPSGRLGVGMHYEAIKVHEDLQRFRALLDRLRDDQVIASLTQMIHEAQERLEQIEAAEKLTTQVL